MERPDALKIESWEFSFSRSSTEELVWFRVIWYSSTAKIHVRFLQNYKDVTICIKHNGRLYSRIYLVSPAYTVVSSSTKGS